MRLEVRFDDAAVAPLLLEGTQIVVGRGAVCDRPITHSNLSYEHAQFVCTDDEWFLEDLGSTNGSWVGTISCKDEAQWLTPGARVKLGTLTGRVHDLDASGEGPEQPKKKRKKRKKAKAPALARDVPAPGAAPKGEPESEAKPDAKAKARPTPSAKAQPKADLEPEAGSGTGSDSGAGSHSGSDSDPDPDSRPARPLASWHVPEEELRAQRLRRLAALIAVPLVVGATGLGVWLALPQEAQTGGVAQVPEARGPSGERQGPAQRFEPSSGDVPDPDAGPSVDGDEEDDSSLPRRSSAADALLDLPETGPESSSGDTDGSEDTDGSSRSDPAGSDTDGSDPDASDSANLSDPDPNSGDPAKPAIDAAKAEAARVDAELRAAIAARDAGRLARLLKAHPNAPGAGAGAAKLHAVEAVLCLERRGTLADGGDAVLREGLGLWTCSRADRGAVRELKLRVVERVLKVSYAQDYGKGLGRTVGGQRLAPHPKRLTVEILQRTESLATFKGKTQINSVQLPPEGLDDGEVWRRLLEPLIPDVRAALLRG